MKFDLSQPRDRVLRDIHRERDRQDLKHGAVQDIPNGSNARVYEPLRDMYRQHTDNMMAVGKHTWLDVLREEVFEAWAEEDPAKLYEELKQVAAVCVKQMEHIARGGQPA